jgi:hypothetical protein
MILFLPITILLVMCILMVVFMAKSKEPGPIDTAEAFLDAILRNDRATLESLSSINSVPAGVVETLSSISNQHSIAGTNYNLSILEDEVSIDTWFYKLRLNLDDSEDDIEIELKKTINRWMVTDLCLNSKKEQNTK